VGLVAAQRRDPGKAGVRDLPEERRTWDKMQHWLRAWKANPGRPSLLFDRGGHLRGSGGAEPAEEREQPPVPDSPEHLRALDPAHCDPVRPSPFAHGPWGALWGHKKLAWLCVEVLAVVAHVPVEGARRARAVCAMALALAWLRARMNRTGPAEFEEDRKCGGVRKPHKDPSSLVKPAHLQGPAGARARYGLHPPVARFATRQALEQEKVRLVLGKLAEGTRRAYPTGWRWWSLVLRCARDLTSPHGVGIQPIRRGR